MKDKNYLNLNSHISHKAAKGRIADVGTICHLRLVGKPNDPVVLNKIHV